MHTHTHNINMKIYTSELTYKTGMKIQKQNLTPQATTTAITQTYGQCHTCYLVKRRLVSSTSPGHGGGQCQTYRHVTELSMSDATAGQGKSMSDIPLGQETVGVRHTPSRNSWCHSPLPPSRSDQRQTTCGQTTISVRHTTRSEDVLCQAHRQVRGRSTGRDRHTVR